jgi:hypothetical protein
MNTNRDQLDDAIDRVATRLTHVEDDTVFASRVIALLPERTTWFGWLTQSWAPRLAMIAVIVVAAVLWNGRRTTEAPAGSQPLASVATVKQPSMLVASVPREALAPVRTKPLERLEPMEPMEPFVGLPSVASPVAIDLASLNPGDLPAEGSLSVPSLVIGDLPLTAETFPQRD